MSDQPSEGLGNVRKLRRDALKAAPAKKPAESTIEAQADGSFLPPGCPVRAIGVAGDVCYYLDQLGQLRELKARDHSRLAIMQLFGRRAAWLYDVWPRRTQDKSGEWVVTGWRPELAAEALMAECARRGVWSAEERVRGPGAWAGPDGELVLHCGDTLLSIAAGDARGGWTEREPGMVGGVVYPTAAPGLKPDVAAQAAGPAGPGAELLALLDTWHWRRPALDAQLLLGWVGAAMLGGALDWRVASWITGGKGTGKSTLQNAIKWLMGDNGLIQTSDATAAAIRQVVQHSCRPVALDEAEAEEDGRRMQALINLARNASSGSTSIRGGQDHHATAFTVRSCFLFSSIHVPPLLGQDRSRIAVLELDPIDGHARAKSAALTPRRMQELGARLLRRLTQNWWRHAATVEAYRAAMQRAGHSARGQDLFGTLLACADLLLADAVPSEDVLAGWENKLAAGTLAEIEGDISDENACLAYLLSSQIDNMRDRVRQTVGKWVEQAVGSGEAIELVEEVVRRESANATLTEYGLKVVVYDHRKWLAIANMHRGLARVFEGTHWQSRPGATGVWVQALRRMPHLVPERPMWFGATARVTMVPAAICLRGDETVSVAPVPEPEAPRPPADAGDGW